MECRRAAHFPSLVRWLPSQPCNEVGLTPILSRGQLFWYTYDWCMVPRVAQAQKGMFQIAAATLSGNSHRQTIHTHRASVHQAAKLVAALLRAAGVTAGLAESNGSLYRRVYDSRHLQADCQEPRDQLPNPALGNRVWANFSMVPRAARACAV